MDNTIEDDPDYEIEDGPRVCPSCNGKGGGRVEHDCPMCQCDEECPDCRGSGEVP